MKALRLFAALFVAFGSLFFATPAQADDAPVVAVVTTPGGDDSSYQIPLTTTVTFDGVQYSSVYATTNSVITFGQPDGTYWTYPSTPSISLYSMDWVVFPWARADEHLTIAASDGGFQVDISARPIWLQNATEPTNINIVAAINVDGTVAISYSIAGPTYDGQTRTGVTLTSGQVVTLEQYGIVKVDTPPVLTPEPVVPTPEPTVEPIPTPTPTIEPTPTPTPTVEPTPEPTVVPTPEPTVEPTPEPTVPTTPPPFVPQGATLVTEGSSVQVVAPEGQRIVSITAWYGDPADGSRGVEVSSTLTQLAAGQTSVTIDSDNRYGDPAGGTVKVLIFVVNYEEIPAPTPLPTETPQTPEPTATPTTTPDPTPTPEPTASPTPQPSQPEPAPTPEPSPLPQPTPPPVVTPDPVVPEPVVTPEPVVPTPDPTPEPVVTPEPQPSPSPVETTPPAIEPEPPVVEPAPKPVVEPSPEPPVVEPTKDVSNIETVDLKSIDPQELTTAEVAQLISAAVEVLATASEGSPQYEKALDALAVAAQADDPQVPEELASIPGVGQAAVAVLNAFNALGNFGADMSPAHRATAKKEVVAAIVLTQVTTAAIGAATSAASSPTSRKTK